MIFKKTKELTATERQLIELDELIDATEATSDVYPDLMEKKKQLMEIQKLEAEVNKTNAEAKGVFKVDKTALLKIGGVALLALLQAGLESGHIKTGSWLGKSKDKFI